MAGWYVRRGEKVIGPVDLGKLKELAAAGKLLPTDQLAKDAAGPWTEAGRTTLFAQQSAETPRLEPKPQSLVPKVECLPVQDQPAQDQAISDQEQQPTSKVAIVVRGANTFMAAVGRGMLAAGGTVVRSISTSAKRRHELKLAKIQAQALADSQRPQAAAMPTGPITFAPQMVQTTVVKVVNRGGGCGCSGCGIILLLLLLGVLVMAVFSNKQPSTSTTQRYTQQTPPRIVQPQNPLPPHVELEPKHYQKVGTQGKLQLVWIDPQYKYDPNVYEQAIKELGGSEDFCMIHFWDNRDQVPSRWPMSDQQVKSEVAQYERNQTTGHERFFYLRKGNMVEPFGNRPSTTPVPPTNPAQLPQPDFRNWTDAGGKHTTEAKYGGIAFGKVKLIKRDGSTVQVPLESLSEDNREWITNRQRRP